MRNSRAIGLFLGTHLAAVNPKPQGLTLSDRFQGLTLSDRFDPFGSFFSAPVDHMITRPRIFYPPWSRHTAIQGSANAVLSRVKT